VVVIAWAVCSAFAVRTAPHVLDVLRLQSTTDTTMQGARADLLLRQRFARPLDEYFALTVVAPAGLSARRPRALLDSLTAALARQPYVSSTVSFASTRDSAFLGRDGKSAWVLLALNATSQDSSAKLVLPVRSTVRRTLTAFGADRLEFQVRVTGLAPLDLDIRTLSAQDSERGELRLLPLTMVVLVLAFGALAAAMLPLLIGVLAIWITFSLIWVLGHHTPMSSFVLNMTTMLGLAMGIDYSLLIVRRFREELSRGSRPADAAARTLATAGVTVVTSGLTVLVGFSALLFTPLVETQSVGVGGILVVAVTVALSTTLLPALLAALGHAIDRPRWLARRLTWYHASAPWESWARSIARRPLRALGLGGLVLGLLAAPVFALRIGLPARGWWPPATEAGQGVMALERMGAGSVIDPIRILVELPPGEQVTSATGLRALRLLSDSLRADPRVRSVKSIVDVRPGMSLLESSVLYSDLRAARQDMPDFLDAYLSRDGRMALLDVFLADTTSLTSAMEVSRRARQLGAAKLKGLQHATVTVGGYTAEVLDVQEILLDRFPLLVLLVLTATGLVLGVVFRSVLVPMKAILMNLLSIAATFGLIVLVFQFGIGGGLLGLPGPGSAVFVLIPVLVFAVAFGLSMDYEVFLLSRIKERFDETKDSDRATLDGLTATASTITSAALIMVLVFGAFAFAGTLAVQILGFGLAVAVLLDATIIRLVLVPAIMHLAGRWNWWPGTRLEAAGRRNDRTYAPLPVEHN